MSENTEKITEAKSKNILDETESKKTENQVLHNNKAEQEIDNEGIKEIIADKIILKNVIPEYIKHLENEGKSKSTRYTVNLDLGYLMKNLGEKKELKNILTVHIAKFFKSETVNTSNNKPRSIHTINQIKRITRQFLVWCKDKEYIDVLPITKEERKFLNKNKKDIPKEKKKEINKVTQTNVDKNAETSNIANTNSDTSVTPEREQSEIHNNPEIEQTIESISKTAKVIVIKG